MDLQLKGKVALVTGASQGIGWHVARVLAEEGCDLGLCARNEAALQAAAERLAQPGMRVVSAPADVTQPESAARWVQACVEAFGRIDVLVNNVGGAMGARLMQSTDEHWQATFELNVFQVVRLIRLAAPHMPPGSAIVNVGSISGLRPQQGGTPQYGASKATLIELTERLALELSRARIRVNTVSPGSIMIEDGFWDRLRQRHPESFDAYVADAFPMGRLGTPEEVADVIAFMASPRANWINGRNVVVDGLQQPTPFREFRLW